ncbi:MAG: hypothetical protein A2268_00415 [Candidatus Raymondbacteria bacterium RifOxyA12_full_50_37]|uniref:HTH gntR-type domain-containing protein n=1 Tax=Candidatus Raymondbacteria bacterium RIFOXYD12_FULL_49_13 TaxID=1817890 RepID=A0A1F7F345_UNCRA|nr:MAG: hypothetical protein A2268_00415 [Candidatus Raymondbacteria bacterium RifOxyA12_full_50_37]OGJ92780.1 MAG: hypothetical protein A2248_04465 [Candidatus Raymondbacteria bacterium RIFOXYA2_FULL_49_16]OGK00982.1 MAG: hypothetical protein A2519_17125 [Candidatus Raymondbacteria bacterium RIFOXYD12_FULL_49_13]OGK02454.1 MAG: hypothetical protein A2487_20760 [Candidatus Raymondbacteria bacterium RifOxyC12_full_50_8]OGP44556.1 MAG: hypothetical protein A2324_10260 [Candidatus Raymondbacteria 
MKYLDIYAKIKADIVSGTFNQEAKLPRFEDMMRLYGCSYKTLRNAIKLLKREGIVHGIPSQGTFIKDIGKSHLYSAFSKKAPMLAMLTSLPFAYSPYYAEMYRTLVNKTTAAGGYAFLIPCGGKPVIEIIREINALNVNFLVTVEFYDSSLRRDMEELGIPIVHIDMLDTQCNKPVINPNNMQGGALALRKLHMLGHRKILFINNYLHSIQDEDTAGTYRWMGTLEESKKVETQSLRKEVLRGLTDTENSPEIRSVAGKYADYTGIIFGTGVYFQGMKRFFHENPFIKTLGMDFVLFSLNRNTEHVNGKPVYFCRWDGEKTGELAFDTLIDHGTCRPRVQFLPMYLEKSF